MGEMKLESASLTRAAELDIETVRCDPEIEAQEDGIDEK